MATIGKKPLRSRGVRLLSLFLVLLVVLVGCNSGLPTVAGEYQIQADSITYDGSQYQFAWIDRDGSVKWAKGDDVQLVEDARTYLEIRDGKPIVHLTADTPVKVLAHDSGGNYTSSWLPFAVGTMIGRQTANNQPAYRYPPTDTIGRGDTITGSTTSTRPRTGAIGSTKSGGSAVSGQSGGSGSGSAATSKSSSGISGQAGGTGSGSAATSKSKSGISGGKSSGGFSGAKSSGGRRK